MNENEVVRMFQKDFGIEAESDDIELISTDGITMAAKIDTLVYGTDVPPGMTLCDAARKSVVACVSDFASKGVRPRWAIISVVLPESYSDADMVQVSSGLTDAAAEFGFAIRGGDTNRGEEFSVSVCLLGICGRTPKRSGAVNGDVICVSGPFGLSAAGLYMSLNDTKYSVANGIDAVMRPVPRLEFGLACARHFTSSMDSSDGLSTTLNAMANSSGVTMNIKRTPVADGIEVFASKNDLDWRDLVYNGGEEYEIVFTVNPLRLPLVNRIAERTGTPIMTIGYVSTGMGVYVDGNILHDRGWKAF